eukprot:319584_1
MPFEVTVLPVFLCCILLLLMLIIVIKSCKYLLCQKTLVIENKHVYVHIIYKKNRPKDRKKVKQEKLTISYSLYIRYTTITALTLYFLSFILVLFSMINIISTSTMYRPLNITAFALWFIARILMTSIFIQRLKSSFYGTIWIINNTWFTYLYILLSMIACLGIVGIILLISQGYIFNEIINFMGMIVFCLMCILDITCSIILTHLFQRKIFELITSYFNIFKNRMAAENMREIQERSNLLQLQLNQDESSNTIATQSIPSLASISYTNNYNTTGKGKHTHITIKSEKDNDNKNGFCEHLISESIVLNVDDEEYKDGIDIHKIHKK